MQELAPKLLLILAMDAEDRRIADTSPNTSASTRAGLARLLLHSPILQGKRFVFTGTMFHASLRNASNTNLTEQKASLHETLLKPQVGVAI